jgi:hypothetical protein
MGRFLQIFIRILLKIIDKNLLLMGGSVGNIDLYVKKILTIVQPI